MQTRDGFDISLEMFAMVEKEDLSDKIGGEPSHTLHGLL